MSNPRYSVKSAKEARAKVVAHIEGRCAHLDFTCEALRAAGYLDCFVGPEMKAIVDALVLLKGHYYASEKFFRGIPKHLQPYPILKMAEDALVGYRKIVRPR